MELARRILETNKRSWIFVDLHVPKSLLPDAFFICPEVVHQIFDFFDFGNRVGVHDHGKVLHERDTKDWDTNHPSTKDGATTTTRVTKDGDISQPSTTDGAMTNIEDTKDGAMTTTRDTKDGDISQPSTMDGAMTTIKYSP